MKTIYKWFTDKSPDGKNKAYARWFLKSFPDVNQFSGSDALMYCYMKYCDQLHVDVSDKYLPSYINTVLRTDLSKYNIQLDALPVVDYTQTIALREAIKNVGSLMPAIYNSYTADDSSTGAFNVDITEYLYNKRDKLITESMIATSNKMGKGADRHDLLEEFTRDLRTIQSTYDNKKVDQLTHMLNGSIGDEEKLEFLTKTGIEPIDADAGGMYLGMLYTLTAQPGSGKTRFSLVHFIYPTLVNAKKAALYIDTELTEAFVRNILVAHHITRMFGVKIPDALISKGELSEEQKHYVNAARHDLFESGNYGTFCYLSAPAIETLEEDINLECDLHPDLSTIVVDYMGRLRSSTPFGKRKDQYQIIADGYDICTYMAKYRKLFVLCINQFSEKGIEAASMGKPIRENMVQGGLVTSRDTWYDIYFTYTEEEKLAGRRSLEVTKCRVGKGFIKSPMQIDLSVSIFKCLPRR